MVAARSGLGNPVTAAAADTADNSSHIVTCSGHVPLVLSIDVGLQCSNAPYPCKYVTSLNILS